MTTTIARNRKAQKKPKIVKLPQLKQHINHYRPQTGCFAEEMGELGVVESAVVNNIYAQ